MTRPRNRRTITKSSADWLLSLYPARWRERYEEEFREVLSECPFSFVVIADTCVGALDAHLHFGQATRRTAGRQRARQCRAIIVAILLLWGAPVAIVSSKAVPYRPLRPLLG